MALRAIETMKNLCVQGEHTQKPHGLKYRMKIIISNEVYFKITNYTQKVKKKVETPLMEWNEKLE